MGNRASFAGTTALITGGASGIGLAIGTELVRRGAIVTLADVDGDALAAAIDRLDAMATATGAASTERSSSRVEATEMKRPR